MNSQRERNNLHLYKGMYYKCMNHRTSPDDFFDITKYPFVPSGCYFCDSLHCNVTPDTFISPLRVIDNNWRIIHYDEKCDLYYHLFHCNGTAYKFECHTMNNCPYYICPFCLENKKYNLLENIIFDAVNDTLSSVIETNPLCLHNHEEEKKDCPYCEFDNVKYSVYQKAIYNYYHRQMLLKMGYTML